MKLPLTSLRVFFAALALAASAVIPASAQEYFWIKGVDDGITTGLHVERGLVEIHGFQPGWYSGQWTVEEVSNTEEGRAVIFRNRWTQKFLALSTDDKAAGVISTLTGAEADAAGAARQGPERVSVVWLLLPGPGGTKLLAQRRIYSDRGGVLTFYACRNNGAVVATATTKVRTPIPAELGWTVESTGPVATEEVPIVRVLEGNTHAALNVETGPVKLSTYKSGWLSAQWLKARIAADQRMVVQFTNVWTRKVLAVENGELTTVAPGPNDAQLVGRGPDQVSYSWQVQGNGTGRSSLQNVKSKLYLVRGADGKAALSGGIAYDWEFESTAVAPPPPPPAPAVYNIVRELDSKHALNIETGSLSSTDYKSGWYSAQWVMEEGRGPNTPFVSFQSRWTNKYISVQNGQLAMVDNPEEPDPQQGKSSTRWNRTMSSSRAGAFAYQNSKTGDYLAIVNGKVALSRTPDYRWDTIVAK